MATSAYTAAVSEFPPRTRTLPSLKYESVCLHAFETGSQLRAGLTRWISYHNARRPHSTLGGRTPDEAYEIGVAERLAALRTTRTKLNSAAKLSNQVGPPQ